MILRLIVDEIEVDKVVWPSFHWGLSFMILFEKRILMMASGFHALGCV